MLILVQFNGVELLEGEHAMRIGEAHWDGETLCLDWGESEAPFALEPQWLPRIEELAPGELAQRVIMSVERVSSSTCGLHRPPLRRARSHRQSLLVLLACCIVGCDDSNGPEPCSDPPGVIRVSGGLNPSISWAAECEAQVVAVFDPQTGFDVWHLTADTRRIPKPVVYGVVAAGAKELHAAEPLQPAMTYGVYVATVVGTDTLGSTGGFTP